MAARASKTGGYDCKFEYTPPDNLVCQICHRVVHTPHQMICCGRVYCKVCLDEHKKRSSTCPNCRKRGQNFSDTRVDQEVKQLLVKCSNSENGCNWSGELQSLDLHLRECGFALLRCTNECTKEERILRRDLDNHLIVCPNRQYECPDCEATGRYCDMTNHVDTCPQVKVCCSNLKCESKVLRCNLSDHLKTCEFTLIPCPNKCMKYEKEVTILRRDLDQHLEKCPNRQHQCPHCKDTGRYCDITTTHLDTCPKMEICCPNSDCKASILRCDLSDHRSKCEFEKVPCKYAGIGCKEKPLRKDQQQHEDDDTFHLHFAIEAVNRQQKEIDKQRKEIDEQREEMKAVKVVVQPSGLNS